MKRSTFVSGEVPIGKVLESRKRMSDGMAGKEWRAAVLARNRRLKLAPELLHPPANVSLGIRRLACRDRPPMARGVIVSVSQLDLSQFTKSSRKRNVSFRHSWKLFNASGGKSRSLQADSFAFHLG